MPVPAAGSPASADEFRTRDLDPGHWVPHYLPHWTTPDRSAARYDLDDDGLRLRIDADQPHWRPEDAPLRVSNLQTATFSGPAGSTRGTHRHRPDGLTVRTPSSTSLLWAPSAGRVEVDVRASTDPGAMLAVWLVGVEHGDPRDSGELCLFEVDGDTVTADGCRARVGVKAHHDPRLRTDMADLEVPVGTGTHTWGVTWGTGGVRFDVDGAPLRTVDQVLDYPLQLMVSLFEVTPVADAGAYPLTARVRAVRGWDG
jgi:beta-glucanase (GH16 family)